MTEADRVPPAAPGKAPLTAAEVRALWQAERKAMRLYTFAVTVLAGALALPHVLHAYGTDLAYVVLLGALLLVAAALVIQLRVRCPRCDARLGTQSLLALPDRCKNCGVAILHPASLDSELDV